MTTIGQANSWRRTPDSDGIPIGGGLLWRSLMATIYHRVNTPDENPVEATIEIMRFVRHGIDSALSDAYDACAPGIVAGVKMAGHYLDQHFSPNIDKALGR